MELQKLKKSLVILTCMLMNWCATVELTPEAKATREIQLDSAHKCKFITSDQVSSSAGLTPMDCAARARKIMRNRVAELGGNAYVLNSVDYRTCATGGPEFSFEVYKCPED
mgnify:CR=1 FL=1